MSDLLQPGRPVVVLLSGGRDSVCLLDLAVRTSGEVTALHVDYGLRPESAADAEFCRELCSSLGVPLRVVRAGAPEGNVQAWAREVRYAAALALPGDVATGHTATDQVETVLYRLAASPGRTALLGMRPREGRVIRPLLGWTREQTAEHCRARGLPWIEDASNHDPRYARNRARAGLVPALRELHPAAEANVLRTLEALRDEAAVLDALVDDVLRGREEIAVAELAALAPALRRLVFRRLGAPTGSRVDEALALEGGTKALDLGGGIRAVVSYGTLRIKGTEPFLSLPDALALPVPGRVAWAGGEVTAERGDFPVADGTLDAAACAEGLRVRAWRAGDRMRPLGLGGSRSLQDLFTDRKVPRAERARLPVVTCGEEIAWVPGVATSEAFRVRGARAGLRVGWRPR
jgi:tRNA(Ile)-lysidine synthase